MIRGSYRDHSIREGVLHRRSDQLTLSILLIHLPTGPVFPSCIFCYPTRFRKWGDTTNYHNSHWVRPCSIYPISLEICEISVDTLFHEVPKYGQKRFKPKISRLLQGKKLSTCSRVMKTTLIVENSTGLPTLFNVVNNIVQHCYTRFRINNIFLYYWQP